jgi:hypothetical protein
VAHYLLFGLGPALFLLLRAAAQAPVGRELFVAVGPGCLPSALGRDAARADEFGDAMNRAADLLRIALVRFVFVLRSPHIAAPHVRPGFRLSGFLASAFGLVLVSLFL